MITLKFEEKELKELMEALVQINVPVRIFLILDKKITESKKTDNPKK